MAGSNYTGMVRRWRDALATDEADVELTARLPDLIGDAELRCLRDLDPVFARVTNVQLSATPGVNTVTLPSACWLPRRIVSVVNGRRETLLQRQHSFLDEFWPDPTLTGRPKYWAMPLDGQAQLAPTPRVGTSLLLDYTQRPAGMTASNPQTWLSLHYPDMLFYAGMIWLAGWTKSYGTGDDPRAAPYWTAEYMSALVLARSEEARKKGEPPFDAGPTRPPVSGA